MPSRRRAVRSGMEAVDRDHVAAQPCDRSRIVNSNMRDHMRCVMHDVMRVHRDTVSVTVNDMMVVDDMVDGTTVGSDVPIRHVMVDDVVGHRHRLRMCDGGARVDRARMGLLVGLASSRNRGQERDGKSRCCVFHRGSWGAPWSLRSSAIIA